MLKKILRFTGNVLDKSSSFLGSTKDFVDFSRGLIRKNIEAKSPEAKAHSKVSVQKDKSQENLHKNTVIPDADNSFIRSKEESLRASQGVGDFSGNAYNGPGKAGERKNSNMSQRNFENHQGN